VEYSLRNIIKRGISQKRRVASQTHSLYLGRKTVIGRQQTVGAPKAGLLKGVYLVKRASSRAWVWIILAAMVITLIGCTPKQQGESKETEGEGEDSGVLKVALLTDGPVSDAGWNAAAYQGLLAMQKELGAEISNLETSAPAQYEEGFRNYASSGYDIVIGHGFQYQDAAKKVGPEFPETIFLVTSGTEAYGDNACPLIFLEEQGYYVMGLLAGLMTKTGKVGLIGGMEIPALTAPFEGFKMGAKAGNPNIDIVTTWIGTWDDVGKAKEATIAQIESGCDVIFGTANQAGLGVLQACAERNVWTFGAYESQIPLAPEVILTEFMLDMENAFLSVGRQIIDGKFKGGVIALGFQDNAIDLYWNDNILDKVSEDVKNAANKALQEIKDGTLKIPEFSLMGGNF
jgi:basic membrane protein A